MNPFNIVAVYTLNGDFIGYTIYRDEASKLQTANLWSESADDVANITEQLKRLNDEVNIRANWPDPRDPAVVALLADPHFEPLVMERVGWLNEETGEMVSVEAAANPMARVNKACEAVARARSNA